MMWFNLISLITKTVNLMVSLEEQSEDHHFLGTINFYFWHSPFWGGILHNSKYTKSKCFHVPRITTNRVSSLMKMQQTVVNQAKNQCNNCLISFQAVEWACGPVTRWHEEAKETQLCICIHTAEWKAVVLYNFGGGVFLTPWHFP